MSIAKIMIIDHTAEELGRIQSIIANEGFTLLTAGSSSEALAIMHSERPDLVFLDADTDADEDYKFSRAHGDIPVILIAQNDNNINGSTQPEHHLSGIIFKPATRENIGAEIDRLQKSELDYYKLYFSGKF